MSDDKLEDKLESAPIRTLADDHTPSHTNEQVSEIFRAQSECEIPFKHYSRREEPGVYLHWERITNNVVAFYQIQRGEQFDGVYQTIATIPWPANEFIDERGHPSYYYRIIEIAPNGQQVGFSQPIPGEELLIRASLMYQLQDYLQMPVIDEEGIMRRGRTSAQWQYQNWVTYPQPEVRMSGQASDGDGGSDAILILSDTDLTFRTAGSTDNYPTGLRYRLDYQGRIYFLDQNDNPVPVASYDRVYASYHVRLFSNSEMNNALYMALQAINGQPGSNKYPTPAGVPFWYDTALITGASYYLLRRLVTGFSGHRERRLLIQDAGRDAFDALGAIREDLKLYKEDWDNILKTLPKAQYPRICAIVQPEAFLPGGRSRFFRSVWKGPYS